MSAALPPASLPRGANAKFANLINVLAGSIMPALSSLETGGSASQIADALIRSMLGGPGQPATISVAGSQRSGRTVASSTSTDALLRSMLGAPALQSGTTVASEGSTDSLNRSTLGAPAQGDEQQSVADMAETAQPKVATPAPIRSMAAVSQDDEQIAANMAATVSTADEPQTALAPRQPGAAMADSGSKRPAKSTAPGTAAAGPTALSIPSNIPSDIPSSRVVPIAPAPVNVPENAARAVQIQDSLPRERPNTLRAETTETAAGPPAELAFSMRLIPADAGNADSPELNDAQNAPAQIAQAPAATAAMNTPAAVQAPGVLQYVPQEADAIAGAPDLPVTIAAAPFAKPAAPSTRAGSTDVKAGPVNAGREDAPAPVGRVAATGAASSGDDFTRTFANAAQAADVEIRGGTNVETDARAPFNSVAESLRNSEPAIAPASPTATTPLQGITIRVATPEAPAVDLHVTERGGEIHVAVRTPDAALQTSLRQDLGTLTNSLERAGYRAETYVPRDTPALAASAPQAGSDRQQQGSSGRGAGGNPSNGQPQQQQRDQRRKTWLQEMENLK